MAGELTDYQAGVLGFIFNFTRRWGYQPSNREICDHFGMRSLNAAVGHVRALERKGWLYRENDSRAIRLVLRPDGTPFRGFEVDDPPGVA